MSRHVPAPRAFDLGTVLQPRTHLARRTLVTAGVDPLADPVAAVLGTVRRAGTVAYASLRDEVAGLPPVRLGDDGREER